MWETNETDRKFNKKFRETQIARDLRTSKPEEKRCRREEDGPVNGKVMLFNGFLMLLWNVLMSNIGNECLSNSLTGMAYLNQECVLSTTYMYYALYYRTVQPPKLVLCMHEHICGLAFRTSEVENGDVWVIFYCFLREIHIDNRLFSNFFQYCHQ